MKPGREPLRTMLPRQVLGLCVLNAFLLLPLLHDIVQRPTRDLDMLLQFNVCISLGWLALAHLAVQRWDRLHLLLLPLYLSTAADLFLITQFGSRLSSGHVSILISDANETADFFATYQKPVMMLLGVSVLVYMVAWRLLRGVNKRATPRLFRACAAVVMALYGGAVLASLGRSDVDLRGAVMDVAAHDHSAPFGVLPQSFVALELARRNATARKARAAYRHDAQALRPGPGEVYVMVIGESSRAENWSILGYERDTNPRLAAVRDVLPMPHMRATSAHTSFAVPSMLSLASVAQWEKVLGQKSIVAAFAEAGFQTVWLSAQSVDDWSGIIPVIASEAHRQQYFDRRMDGALFEAAGKFIRESPSDGRMLIVIHTRGSHFEYERRYPPDQAWFQSRGGRRQRIVDAYDNSIRYTDALLAKLIRVLQDRGKPSALLYSSDHGENLLDDGRLLGHAVGNEHDLKPAAFVWISPEMQAAHPQQWRSARRHVRLPLSLSNLSHSLLDLAGIHAKGLDPSMSIFSSQFEVRPRSWIVRDVLYTEDAQRTAAALSGSAGAGMRHE